MIGSGMLVGKFELKPLKKTNLGVTRGIFHSKKILLKTEWARSPAAG